MRNPTEAETARDRLAAHLDGIDAGLLRLAMTHRSYCAEHPGVPSNERLEFLGDAVLGVVVAEHLFTRLPGVAEGDLARMRAAIVSTEALAPIARTLGIGPALLLGRGEELSGGREKASLLADALEALIGAAFLDGGLDRARPFVLDHLEALIDREVGRAELGDPKNRLQELANRRGDPAPRYVVESGGPDHDRSFRAAVEVSGVVGRGAGTSKRRAERAAATDALSRLAGETEGR